MIKIIYKFNLYIGLNIIIILLCLYSAFELRHKGDLPFKVVQSEDHVVITEDSEKFKGYRINSVNNISVSSREMIEVILDASKTGDEVVLQLSKDLETSTISLKLVPFYTIETLIIQSLVSIVFFILGFLFLLKIKNRKFAVILNSGILSIGILILMTWGSYNRDLSMLSYLIRVVFHIAYSAAPIIFLHIIAIYPVDRQQKFIKILISLYLLGFIISLPAIYYFFILTFETNRQNIIRYLEFFNIQRILMTVGVISSLAIFIYSSIKTKDTIEKKRIKWLILGYAIGPLSYILLWVIPQGVMDRGLIPEDYILILMLSIPISYFISIFKYRLFDIELFFKRSLVYFLILSMVFGLYFLFIYTISFYLKEFYRSFLDPVIALLLVILFNPLKNKIHNFVDKKFYKIEYDFRITIKNMLVEIENCHNYDELINKLFDNLKHLLGISGIIINEYDKENKSIKIIKADRKISDISAVIPYIEKCKETPYAYPEIIENGIQYETITDDKLKSDNIYLIYPTHSIQNQNSYFLLLGKKNNDERYLVEDVDLLNTIVSSIIKEIEKLKLKEEILKEKFEKEKLDELYKQKSLFVSAISHDLKTPLASIKLFTEIINSGYASEEKKKQYLTTIDGEVDRLNRLIENLLNFSRIEKGIKEYSFLESDLRTIVQKAINLMEYQIRINNFELLVNLPDDEYIIKCDTESLIEVLLNLISNSLKYSLDKKQIELNLFEEDRFYCLSVKDHGIGIPKEEIGKIFQPYFRTRHSQQKGINGTGLGLYIVKSVISSHDGEIDIISDKEKGTQFILKFPKIKREVL